MASDTSDFAVALYLVEGMPDFSFSDELKEEEKKTSSSHRELLAILRTLEYMLVTGKWRPGAPTTLWWLTNNQNVEKMLSKGSGKLSVMRLVLDIMKRGRELQFSIEPVWVSRDNPFLQKADALSKGIDSDNWAISV
jgi:hypothetical protein